MVRWSIAVVVAIALLASPTTSSAKKPTPKKKASGSKGSDDSSLGARLGLAGESHPKANKGKTRKGVPIRCAPMDWLSVETGKATSDKSAAKKGIPRRGEPWRYMQVGISGGTKAGQQAVRKIISHYRKALLRCPALVAPREILLRIPLRVDVSDGRWRAVKLIGKSEEANVAKCVQCVLAKACKRKPAKASIGELATETIGYHVTLGFARWPLNVKRRRWRMGGPPRR